MKYSILFLLIFHDFTAQSQEIDTLIDAGNFKLHFKILKGNNAPILFESGGGLNASQWQSITSKLHSQLNATIITYDRQGFGESGLDTANYNILSEIEGLEYGLNKLGLLDSPLMIVSHSLVAYYSRIFAFNHPKTVKAILMLDPRIPLVEDLRFAAKTARNLNISEFEYKDLNYYYLLSQIESNGLVVVKHPIPAHIQVRIMMAENGPFDSLKENKRFKKDQIMFLKEHTNSSLIRIKRTSHNIVLDKPDLVFKEVISLYNRVVVSLD